MNNSDRLNYRLSRRKVLALLRAGGAASIVIACSPRRSSSARTSLSLSSPAPSGTLPPACVVRPQQTEGPYFVDERLNRSDIRSDPANNVVKAGTELRLIFQVSQVQGQACNPLPGATVDLWHCDAQGVYSDVQDRSFDTRGQQFLRGYQVTDNTGTVQFVTIYPGWYPGRTVHLHFKVRTNATSGQTHEFISQLYFDDRITDQVYAQAPYTDTGRDRLRNAEDGIFQRGGDQLLLPLTRTETGYRATFRLGLQTA